jgi:CMP-N-acetylneuraminic acid synthetase
MKILAMIPARLGSQRLEQKNLQDFLGEPLIAHTIKKCIHLNLFDEIWVNSESQEIGNIANKYEANFHKRPTHLADNKATSEQFVYEFLKAHTCDYLVQVHSIAPLLSSANIKGFIEQLKKNQPDVLLSAIHEQIECALNGKPMNFTFLKKENSQDLTPLQKITWSITSWKSSSYISEFEKGNTATYNGNIDIFQVDPISGHVIKTLKDLKIAEALWPLVK